MSTASLAPASLRIQLEGALETLEQGERRYASLVRRLAGARWKRRLREDPGLLAEVRAQEPVLVEALARVERRARQEQWPQAHPVRVLMRVLGVRQQTVASLVRERLASLGACKDASLAEVLAELEARVLEPVAPLPAPTEEVLLKVNHGRALPVLPILLGGGLPLGIAGLIHGFFPPWAAGLLGVGLAWGMASWSRLTPGGFWLMRERLVYRTRSGDVAEVRLSSLSANDVELLPSGAAPGGVELRLRGPRPLCLPSLRLAPAEWLTLLRALPQPEGEAPPGEDFVLVRASLASGYIGNSQAGETHGLLVLQPGSVAFIPLRYAESLGRWGELLTRVRRLSPQALDRFVWMAVEREAGQYFNPAEVHASPATTDSVPGYRFILRGQAVLVGATDASQQAALARLLQRWRQRLLWP